MRRKGFHWAWVILAVCFVDFFVNYSIGLGYGIVFPEKIRSIGLNRTQGGTIYNFYLAAYVCLTPFAGNLFALVAAFLMQRVKRPEEGNR